MARKPENFQNCFCFADIFDRIRQNLGFHLMLEIFHDSFLKMITRRTFKMVSFGDVRVLELRGYLSACMYFAASVPASADV